MFWTVTVIFLFYYYLILTVEFFISFSAWLIWTKKKALKPQMGQHSYEEMTTNWSKILEVIHRCSSFVTNPQKKEELTVSFSSAVCMNTKTRIYPGFLAGG
jgi:hypothetical protein